MGKEMIEVKSKQASTNSNKMTITQAGLAQLLGIDRTSVSKILNRDQKSSFLPEMVERVQKAAWQYGYRNLRRTMKEVGFVAPHPPRQSAWINPKHYRLLEFIFGINEVFSQEDGKLLLIDPTQVTESSLLNPDGLIFLESNLEILDKLPRPNIPYIVINRIPKGYTGSYVIHDEILAHQLRAQYLREQGHSQIAYLTRCSDSHMTTRFQEIRDQFMEVGMDIRRDCSLLDYDEKTDLGEWVVSMIQKGITAVVVTNDMTANFLISAAISRGLDIPKDISVIGDNHIPCIEGYSMGRDLTSVVTPWWNVANRAATVLLQSLREGQPLQYQEKVAPIIYKGNTVRNLKACS